MKIKCLHGFFLFEPTSAEQLSDFISTFGLGLVSYNDKYTFSELNGAPNYSFTGADYMGLPAVQTFEGKPWEVFQANGFVFNFVTGIMQPILSVNQPAQLLQSGRCYISNGLLLPGSVLDDGSRVKAYSAWYSWNTQRFIYSDVGVGLV